MTTLTKAVDANFPENAHAEIVGERHLILRKPTRSEPLEALHSGNWTPQIIERMESIGVVDVLIDVDRWLDLHKLFRPLAGTESRME